MLLRVLRMVTLVGSLVSVNIKPVRSVVSGIGIGDADCPVGVNLQACVVVLIEGGPEGGRAGDGDIAASGVVIDDTRQSTLWR